MARKETPASLLGRVVNDCLERGDSVTIDGLGVFSRDDRGEVDFVPDTRPRVFIAYVSEDAGLAVRLHQDLAAAGFNPWLDRRKLLAGQNWRGSIEHAIEAADLFVPCFSARAATKRGQFPCEVRHALRCAERMPLDDNFILPVRLEPCVVPGRLAASIQFVDLFPDWDAGMNQLLAAMRFELESRRTRYPTAA
jgi:hypothetical protein